GRRGPGGGGRVAAPRTPYGAGSSKRWKDGMAGALAALPPISSVRVAGMGAPGLTDGILTNASGAGKQSQGGRWVGRLAIENDGVEGLRVAVALGLAELGAAL